MSDIDRLINKDSLAEAECITGKSYKNDGSTLELGAMMHMTNAEKKHEALEEAGDTTFSMATDDYIEVIERIGFQKIYEESFQDDGHEECYYIYWFGKKGILLEFDTHRGRRNAATMYYNIKLKEDLEQYTISSGGFVDIDERIWSGNHDAREAIIHKINKLSRNGIFLRKWQEQPFHWLTHFGDPDCDYPYDEYKELTKKRIKQFPDEVINKING